MEKRKELKSYRLVGCFYMIKNSIINFRANVTNIKVYFFSLLGGAKHRIVWPKIPHSVGGVNVEMCIAKSDVCTGIWPTGPRAVQAELE